MARRIEIWPTNRLVPYAKNARTHSPEQVAQIAASIVEFGFVNPILVDTNAGIIAGHGRLLAARKLGLGECPVVVLGAVDLIAATQRGMPMPGKPTTKRSQRKVLRLNDRDQAKRAVLNAIGSVASVRAYSHAIDDFIGWYSSEPRL